MRRYIDVVWHKILKRPYRLAARFDVGSGQTVVFLHGIAARAEGWEPVISLLDTTEYRAIALDVLGFGESPRPDWLDYSVDDHADSIMATLRAMHVKGPIILVGHSMGSLIAARITKRHPKYVKHLVLYQAPVYSQIPSDISTSKQRLKLHVSIYEKLLENPKRTLAYIALLGRLSSRAIAVELNEQTWLAFEMSLRHTIIEQEIYQDLRVVRAPVDIIYGRFDVLVMRKDMKRVFKNYENITFHEINETHRITPKAARLLHHIIVTGRDNDHD